MKLRLLKDVSVGEKNLVADQVIETNEDLGATLLANGDAEFLQEDQDGCFVQV